MLACASKLKKIWIIVTVWLFVINVSAIAQPMVVWPGDTNLDGIVDNDDVLNIGLAFGATGPPRQGTPNINFLPQPFIQLWGQHLPVSGLDYVYIDCNGDGIIDDQDMLAIEQNYLLTQPDVIPQIFDTLPLPGPALMNFQLDNDTVGFGDSVMISIYIESPGDSTFTDSVVYGLAFTFNYDVFFTKDDATSIAFPNTWLGEQGLSIPFGRVRTDTFAAAFKSSLVTGETGKVDAAKVRIDDVNKAGSGIEFRTCIVMDENIFKPSPGSNGTTMPMEIGFSDIKMISNNEQIIPVFSLNHIIYVNKPASCDTGTLVANLSESNIMVNSVNLEWDTVADAIGYEISGGLATTPVASFITISVPNSSSDHFSVIGLQPGTTYQWRIRPLCNSGIAGSWTPVRLFTTAVCSKPTPATTINITNNAATLSWTSTTAAIGYQIVGGAVGSSNLVTLNIIDPLQNSLTVNNLPSNTQFQWRIRTACGSLSKLTWSGYSAINLFTTLSNSPVISEKLESSLDGPAKIIAGFQVYPNPVGNQINVIMQDPCAHGDIAIAFYDLSGKLIREEIISCQSIYSEQFTISTLGLKNGIYQITVQSGSQIRHSKIVVNR